MTHADQLLADLRTAAESARAEYWRLRETEGDTFDSRQRKALQAWADAACTEDGARQMMRAIIADGGKA